MLTPEVLQHAQELLDENWSRAQVAEELGVSSDTLRKALADGRLRMPVSATGLDKSTRSGQDAAAAQGMGTACRRTEERMLAAVGKLKGAAIRFEACRDVPYAGVLCGLPALIQNGLLNGVDQLLNRATTAPCTC